MSWTEPDRGDEPPGARETADPQEARDTDATAATPDAAGRDDDHHPQHHGAWYALRELAIVVGMALLISLVVKTFLLQAFWIPSGSMESTLDIGDRVVVSKLTPGPFDLQRGDVVVFDDFNHWLETVPPEHHSAPGKVVNDVLTFVGLLPTNEGNHLIKRIIGMPGDHVVCCDKQGRLKINGVSINEPYVHPGDAPSEKTFDITVPPGRVWVMGDHRSDSGDSRYHDDGTGAVGSVPESAIVGRAVAIVWPLSRWSWLGNHQDTFARVPDPSPKSTR